MLCKSYFPRKECLPPFLYRFRIYHNQVTSETGVSVTCVGIYEEAYATTTATATKTLLKK